MVPKVIGIHKLAAMLDCTPPSIYSHIARKNWEAIPPPICMGTRLAWAQDAVDEWLCSKMNESVETNKKANDFTPKKIGRPTKKETVLKQRRNGHVG